MINLIQDPWIPVRRLDGQLDKIAPWQIAEAENPVVEINAPRPDFKSGLYQFLIGLLQVAVAPEDDDEWAEVFHDGLNAAELKTKLAKYAAGFNLYDPKGVAFLQDYDLPDGEVKAIAALLIETPGGKTVKDNLDHFIKRDQHQKMCPSCAATALFTLQANAPSGGVGHRVGLRGGGPITSIVTYQQPNALLWQTLWCNVFDQESMGSDSSDLNPLIFPWLALTRTSEKKDAITTPEDVDLLQSYWGMPRRIRFEQPTEQSGHCDTCGQFAEQLFTHFRTKNYGVNYDGGWVHPLTAYKFDPKEKNFPLSLKGQQGGMSYRNWLSQVMKDEEGNHCADVVKVFNDERIRDLPQGSKTSLWCSGYDMDNMKARCWYEHNFPLFNLSAEQQDKVQRWAHQMLVCANATVSLLRTYVKLAWANRPGDLKGDFQQLTLAFWQHSEQAFYQLLTQLVEQSAKARFAFGVHEQWLKVLFKTLMQQFDAAVLSFELQDRYLQRAIEAKEELKKKFTNHKDIKNMKKAIVNDKKQQQEEEVV